MKFKLTQSKFLRVGALGAALLIGQSCSNSVLDEQVISGIGNDYLNTPTGLNDGVNATYSVLRQWWGTETGNNLTAFGTDTYTNGADGGHKFINRYDGQFDSRSNSINDAWNDLYVGINAANAVIDRAPNVTGMAENIRKQRVAEVKFLRAHYYFILTRTFGGVDLRLSETTEPTKVATRATIPEMYAAIIKDLMEAIPDLENKARSSDYGRVTRPWPSICWRRCI